MENSEQQEQPESIVAEQQIIHILLPAKESRQPSQVQFKYATINQIRSFERASQTHNNKFIEKRPLLFSEDDFVSSSLHYKYQNGQQSLAKDGKSQNVSGVLDSSASLFTLKTPISNIKRQNTLILGIKNLKRRYPLQLQNIETDKGEELVRYKYIFMLNEVNLLIKVLLELNGIFKVWKEMEVPLSQNKCQIQIHEFNNEQTDIKVNDFTFHLLLKMPFHQQTNYRFIHNSKAQIYQIQFTSKSEKPFIQSKDTYCTKECQLI